MRLYKFFLPAFALLMSLASCSSGPSEMRLTGHVLKDLDGNAVKLSDYKGKIIFADFWASWCPPCRQSIPAVEKLYGMYKDNPKVVFLGINVDENPRTVADFVKESGITYKILIADAKVLKAFNVRSIPVFFVIDGSGNITNKHTGYMPGLETQWEQDIEFLLKK